jgi:dipeptidyl aminopeptidase/acylaminoacyl peptidase
VDQKLPGRVNRLSCRRCSGEDRVVLVFSYSARDPGHWFVVQGGAPLRWQDVGRARKRVDPRQMANVEFHRIAARDGRELPVWLTVPSGRGPGVKGPAVVMVHGGPWLRGGHWAWDAMDQFLASRGYLVIKPEFRGSLGYGDAHYRAGWREWGRAMQDDVADALLWAVRQGRVDPARACIAGASYGGYSTLMGLIRHPELYRCGIAWLAVTDPRLMFEPLWRSDFSDDIRRYELPALIGDPTKDAQMLREVSPVAQAARLTAPLLLAFGEYDSRVPIDHAKALRSALRDAGREPEYVVYPGEGHGWLKPATRLDFGQRIERFLARHIGAP